MLRHNRVQVQAAQRYSFCLSFYRVTFIHFDEIDLKLALYLKCGVRQTCFADSLKDVTARCQKSCTAQLRYKSQVNCPLLYHTFVSRITNASVRLYLQ